MFSNNPLISLHILFIGENIGETVAVIASIASDNVKNHLSNGPNSKMVRAREMER